MWPNESHNRLADFCKTRLFHHSEILAIFALFTGAEGESGLRGVGLHFRAYKLALTN